MTSNIFHILVLHFAILLHYRTIEKDVNTDPLTGLVSRRHFTELATREISRARRFGDALGLMMIDVDHFKRINDTHGHAVGDRALVAFADACRNSLRSVDIVARLGGDEFVALIPATCGKDLAALAERLRQGVAEASIARHDGSPLSLTASIGLASAVGDAIPELGELMRQADASLYRAKAAGRNTVGSDPEP